MFSQASKLQCAGIILLVFLAGILTGATGMSFRAHAWMHKSVPFYTEAGKQIWLDRWKKDLNLTADQAAEMQTILDDFVVYYRTVLANGKSRILQILNEDQKQKFSQMLDDAKAGN